MPNTKNFTKALLILFVLLAIPLTIQVARRNDLISKADGLDLSVQAIPSSREIAVGTSGTFQLELNVPSLNIKNQTPVFLSFSDLPAGVTLSSQPLGATPSNYFQKSHLFNVMVDSTAKAGKYTVEVIASDLKNQHKTAFSFIVK